MGAIDGSQVCIPLLGLCWMEGLGRLTDVFTRCTSAAPSNWHFGIDLAVVLDAGGVEAEVGCSDVRLGS